MYLRVFHSVYINMFHYLQLNPCLSLFTYALKLSHKKNTVETDTREEVLLAAASVDYIQTRNALGPALYDKCPRLTSPDVDVTEADLT